MLKQAGIGTTNLLKVQLLSNFCLREKATSIIQFLDVINYLLPNHQNSSESDTLLPWSNKKLFLYFTNFVFFLRSVASRFTFATSESSRTRWGNEWADQTFLPLLMCVLKYIEYVNNKKKEEGLVWIIVHNVTIYLATKLWSLVVEIVSSRTGQDVFRLYSFWKISAQNDPKAVVFVRIIDASFLELKRRRATKFVINGTKWKTLFLWWHEWPMVHVLWVILTAMKVYFNLLSLKKWHLF